MISIYRIKVISQQMLDLGVDNSTYSHCAIDMEEVSSIYRAIDEDGNEGCVVNMKSGIDYQIYEKFDYVLMDWVRSTNKTVKA